MPASAKLGQNFLHDKHIAAKIVNMFLQQPGQDSLAQTAGGTLRVPTSRSLGSGGPSRPAWTGPVLEIGAGPGILSGLLLDHIPAEQLTLVEIDRFLARQLRQRFGDPPHVIEEDILKLDLARLYPKERVAVIGNLPYHISKELVDWFIAQRGRIAAAVLMLQKDFVDKVLAAPGGKKYNAQSVLFQLLFQARRCFHVPAGAFTPAPRIMSTVIAVRPADSALMAAADEFYPFVKLCFAERRKTLWNNLAPREDKNILAAAFAARGLAATIRAEQLPPDSFPGLFAALNGKSAEKDGDCPAR